MAEFLVRIAVSVPDTLEDERRAELLAAERVRGRELVDAGTIVRIWRIPGAMRNVGVWSAADATELHGLLRSLPFAPWSEFDVTALAAHPLEGGPDV